MSAAPPLTVLMAVRDGAAYLDQAVRSILGQTFGDFEFVVVDDGSGDDTLDRLRRHRDSRVRILENGRPLGLPASLNRGLGLARAALVARQDADDVSHPRRLEQQLAFLSRHPEVALLGTQGWFVDDRGHRLAALDHGAEPRSIRLEMLFDNAFAHSSVIFRRDAVTALGGYDETFAFAQDYGLWARLVLEAPAANLPARLIRCRRHGGSMTARLVQERVDDNRRIVRAYAAALLAGDLNESDRESLIRFTSGVDDGSLGAFQALFARVMSSFARRHPGPATEDFRRTVARKYASFAFGSTPRSTRRLWRAWRHGPSGYPVLGAAAAIAGWRVRAAVTALPFVRTPGTAQARGR